MNIADVSTPVVVLISPHHCGLSVLRSLGRLGVKGYSVDASSWNPASLSRHCRGTFVWDLNNEPVEKSLDRLTKIAQKIGGRPILIPTTDRIAMFVADYSASLNRWYRFPVQDADLIHRLCSKKEMCALASAAGVATPRSFYARNRAEIYTRLEGMQFPLIVKGEGYLRRAHSETKVVVKNPQELMHLCNQIDNQTLATLVIQEFIPGGVENAWMFNGYFDESSRCLAAFTGRKVRQLPIHTGITSLGISARNQELERVAIGFMRALAYRGIVDMDFCYDVRDGQYKVLDVNPRIGSTFRLFVSEQGLDVARALYLDLTGQQVPFAPVAESRRWMAEDFDLVASFQYWRRGELKLRDWAKSLRGLHETAFFAADDPLPLVAMLREDIYELWLRTGRGRRPVPPFQYDARLAAPQIGR